MDNYEDICKRICLLPEYEEAIPSGYKCDSEGVFIKREDGKYDQITTRPIAVTASSRNQYGEGWGVVTWWEDHDSVPHEHAFPKRMFHSQGTELAQKLADSGLPIVPGKEKALLIYLGLFNPAMRVTAAHTTGWINSSFVFPTRTLKQPAGELIVYQPPRISNHHRVMRSKGTHARWKEGMRSASPMLMFLVCASLSAPWRYKLGVEAGGIHIYDETSRGKTTGLQAASSCWGCGADPQRVGGSDSYLSRWNATANALEAKAELHNDLPMIVDEIGEGDTREFGRTIYRIISGTGRDRSEQSGGLRNSRSWRILIISAGELAVSDFIEQGGNAAKGGQLVRMIDINLDYVPSLFKDSLQADAMKELCAEHYGHAGPLLIERVTNEHLSAWRDLDFESIGPATSPIEQRARKRFGLVLFTGHMASKLDVIPWTEDEVLNSVRLAYQAWLSQVRVVSDTDRGLTSLINFILANEEKFETYDANYIPRDRAGWKRDDRYHFTASAFKQAIGGADPTKIKRLLQEEGLLHATKGLNSTIRVDGNSVSVVSVKKEILNSSSDEGGSEGSNSSELDAACASGATTPTPPSGKVEAPCNPHYARLATDDSTATGLIVEAWDLDSH